MMRHIIVFSSQGCKFCDKSKHLLTQHKLSFTAFDVDLFPHRYKQAVAFSHVHSVPLIFVGNDFIGGASELEEILKNQEKFEKTFFVRSSVKVNQNSTDNNDSSGNDTNDNNDNNNNKNNSSLPFLSLPLTDEEAATEQKLKMKRKQEEGSDDLFLSQVLGLRDLTFTTSSSSSSSSASVNFTYSELLEYLRYNPSTRVPREDRRILLFCRRPQTVLGSDLVECCKKFLVSKNVDAGLATSFAKSLANALISARVKMLYDADTTFFVLEEEATTTTSTVRPNVEESKLYRFAVDACDAGDFGNGKTKMILNAHRSVGSFQKTTDEFFDFALSDSAGTSSSSCSLDNICVALSPQQSVALSRALWRCQNQLLSCDGGFRDKAKINDDGGGLVDYTRLRSDVVHGNPFKNVAWRRFKDLSCLLQLVDPSSFASDEQKIAFGINLYNTAVYCGLAEFLVPWSTLEKLSFFGGVGVLLKTSSGPTFFSLNDLENGMLRGNRKGVTDFISRPFAKGDIARLSCCVRKVDYRVHFGLNCGARSCPPIKLFSAENLDDELEMAATAFIQSTCSFNEKRNVLTVSQILKWYKEDFEQGQDSIQKVVLKYLMKQDVAVDTRQIQLEYAPYDWEFAAKKD